MAIHKLGYFYLMLGGRMEYTHREVARLILGRSLCPGEVVHHIDEDKLNNDQSNLQVFKTRADHVRFHALPEGRREVLRLDDGAFICREKPSEICVVCGTPFIPTHRRKGRPQKSCSHECAARLRIVVTGKKPLSKSITAKKLHELMWSEPATRIARRMKVSDTAIKKLAILHGVPRPGRGFWAKIEAGQLEGQSCPLPGTGSNPSP
jgi:hypothetical protein